MTPLLGSFAKIERDTVLDSILFKSFRFCSSSTALLWLLAKVQRTTPAGRYRRAFEDHSRTDFSQDGNPRQWVRWKGRPVVKPVLIQLVFFISMFRLQKKYQNRDQVVFRIRETPPAVQPSCFVMRLKRKRSWGGNRELISWPDLTPAVHDVTAQDITR